MKMSATYNLKNEQDYKDFMSMVIKDLDDTNPKDGKGTPLKSDDEPIDIEYLWEEFGHFLDGTQTGLGNQVFSEVLFHYNKPEILPMEKANITEVKTLYVLKAFDWDGNFYGYYAKHPDEEDLPFYDDDVNNAITFENACDAEFLIDDLENGAELQIIVEKVHKVSVKLDDETVTVDDNHE